MGRIISIGLAVGPVARFMICSLYTLLEAKFSWCDYLTLSQEAFDEVSSWVNCLSRFKSQPVWHSPSAVRVLYTDASDTGFGGYVVERGPCIVHGQ